MPRFLILLFVIAFAGLAAQPGHAQSLKKVSASKYQTRTPIKGFTFSHEEPLSAYPKPSFPDGLDKVTYRRADKRDSVYGVRDTRGKRATWLLQPHYQAMWAFADNTLVARHEESEDNTLCVIRVGESACTPTEFRGIAYLAYHDYPLPDWVNRQVLYRRDDRSGDTIALQLFAPDGAPLMKIENVMFGRSESARGGDRTIKAYRLDDNGLSIRIKSPDGEISDLLLHRQEDGSFTQLMVPPFSILEGGLGYPPLTNGKVDWAKPRVTYSAQKLMFTADVDLQLVWPYYEVDGGFRTAPADLLGLMPLSFRYDDNVFSFIEYGDNEAALHFCCSLPLGWAVAWAGEDGPVFALLQQKGGQVHPTYEAVMASRDDAIYTQIEKLWTPGTEKWGWSRRDDALKAGVQIGEYAMHRADGQVDIYRGETGGLALNEPIWVKHTVSEAGFPAWIEQTMRASAQRRAEADAAWKAQKVAEQERKEAYQRLLSEQKARLARVNREAAEARAAERQASYEAARALENEEARKQAEYAAQIAEANKSRALWNSWRYGGNTDAGSSSAPRPRIDYWKSYDSSNTSGQYVTSSGGATGCLIGDPNC